MSLRSLAIAAIMVVVASASADAKPHIAATPKPAHSYAEYDFDSIYHIDFVDMASIARHGNGERTFVTLSISRDNYWSGNGPPSDLFTIAQETHTISCALRVEHPNYSILMWREGARPSLVNTEYGGGGFASSASVAIALEDRVCGATSAAPTGLPNITAVFAEARRRFPPLDPKALPPMPAPSGMVGHRPPPPAAWATEHLRTLQEIVGAADMAGAAVFVDTATVRSGDTDIVFAETVVILGPEFERAPAGRRPDVVALRRGRYDCALGTSTIEGQVTFDAAGKARRFEARAFAPRFVGESQALKAEVTAICALGTSGSAPPGSTYPTIARAREAIRAR